jgi:PAS domain S-box-containing protein
MILNVVLALAAVVATAVAIMARQHCSRLQGELVAARDLFELANDPVLVADIVRGRIIEVNGAAGEMLGYSRERLLELTLPELHPPERRAESAEIIADVWEKKGLVYKLPFLSADGEHIEVEISAKVFQMHGQASMLLFARDIRERNRLERQLVQSEKMAALGQLVAGVAHEINTPIGSIHSNAGISKRALGMVQKALETDDVKQALGENRKLARALKILDENVGSNQVASERIVEVVRALKNFARLDESDFKKANLHDGLDNTMMLLRHELKHGVEVTKNYGELPHVECFPNQLNQVFMNIMVNAVQAMGGKGALTVETKVDGDHVLVRIGDSGKGIPKEDLGRIFDPGFTRKGVGVGTGLGLSISYQIIERHKGAISVESEVGKGSTFEIRLPIESSE